MNDINDIQKDADDSKLLENIQDTAAEFSTPQEWWDYFVNEIRDLAKSTENNGDAVQEVITDREYGVKECADVAIGCFTPEVIREWGSKDLNERNAVIQEYATGIGNSLGIDFKGIIWEQMPAKNGSQTMGYACGDGYLHLNVQMLSNPAALMQLVDVVAHEARHQLQKEAMRNPERFPIQESTIKEWRVAQANYTTEYPSAYDPWGYTYNPMEMDSRYFGESMVRELTKHLINA